MFKKLLFLLAFSLIILNTPKPVLAATDFSTAYDVTYDIDEAGVAKVTEEIILTNLTDKLYASSFSLTIGATDISEVEARDSSGPLKFTVTRQDRKTQIKVEFSKQVVGKGKEYPWTLTFKSRDFSQKIGNSWQVMLPKIATLEDLNTFDLTLRVPVSFGDPASIRPEPIRQNESGGKLNFYFSKEQLTTSGVFASFGETQGVNFSLTYKASNDSVLPKLIKASLPADASYQEVAINNIEPKPENVTADTDGNYIGWFKINPRQTLNITVTGQAVLHINNLENMPPLTERQRSIYLSSNTHWETENPAIKLKLSEILGSGQLSEQDKIKKIYRFVTDSLKFDFEKLSKKDYPKLGAVTVLNNPEEALASDFADLFVTLARSSGIPARKLVGFAYSNNSNLRPLSYSQTVSAENIFLHAWAEYYDPKIGWVMVDPTWEQTTGGVDYFLKTDLSHFVISTLGSSNTEEILPVKIDFGFTEDQINHRPNVMIDFKSPRELFAGFPSKAVVTIKNNGNAFYHPDSFSISSAKIDIPNIKNFNTPTIPPFGHLVYTFDLKTNSLWESYEDILQVRFGDKSVDKKLLVKPFFAYKYFSAAIIIIILVMAGVYLFVLTLFIKTHKTLVLTPDLREGKQPEKAKSKISAVKKATRIFKKKAKSKSK